MPVVTVLRIVATEGVLDSVTGLVPGALLGDVMIDVPFSVGPAPGAQRQRMVHLFRLPDALLSREQVAPTLELEAILQIGPTQLRPADTQRGQLPKRRQTHL